MEAYTLVKHLRFDFAAVQDMSSVERRIYLGLFGEETAVRKKSMEDMASKRYGG